MPTDLFMAYVDAMPRIRAERLLDAAQATMAQFHKADWWDGLLQTAGRDDGGAVAPRETAPPSALRFNRKPVSSAELQGHLSEALGGGFRVA